MAPRGGGYQSAGVWVDWHDFVLAFDRNLIGPRTYTFTYAVIDNAQNSTDVDCIVHVVDPDGEPPPPADGCDGIDNDGDGQIDEDFAPRAINCGVGQCQAQGATTCVNGVEVEECTPSAPVAERCGNGLDEDCDGTVDEGFDVGGACSASIGACARAGQMACTADGTDVVCDAVAGAPSIETCDNGVDEDCDGEVDELGCEAPASCDPDLTGPVVTVAEPENDCDGETDEGFDAGDACSAGIGACRVDGVRVCHPDGLDTICDAVPAAAGSELCGNGIDDDCDGETGEGFDTGAACEAGVGACLTAGGTDIDEDCDGEIDEGFDPDLACPGAEDCSNDLVAPRVTVGRPVVQYSLRDEAGWIRVPVIEACELTWVDGCIAPERAIHGINHLESPSGEAINGGPGAWWSTGIGAEWYNVELNLNRAEVGPRSYAIRYAVHPLRGHRPRLELGLRRLCGRDRRLRPARQPRPARLASGAVSDEPKGESGQPSPGGRRRSPSAASEDGPRSQPDWSQRVCSQQSSCERDWCAEFDDERHGSMLRERRRGPPSVRIFT